MCVHGYARERGEEGEKREESRRKVRRRKRLGVGKEVTKDGASKRKLQASVKGMVLW